MAGLRSKAADLVVVPMLCVVAAALLFELLAVAIPVLVGGIAYLTYRRSWHQAGGTALVCVVVAVALQPLAAVMAVPTMAVVWWAAKALERREAWRVAAIVGVVSYTGVVSWMTFDLMRAGQSPASFFKAVGDAWMAAVRSGELSTGVETEAALQRVADVLSLAWPALLLVMALAGAYAGVWLAGRIGRLLGRKVSTLTPVAKVDVSPHWMWPVIAALGSLLVARLTGEPLGWAAAIGWNLALLSWAVLGVQGFGVAETLFMRLKLGPLFRVLIYGLMLWLGVLFPALGVAGLADLWINSRGLPRDGENGSGHESEDGSEHEPEHGPEGGSEDGPGDENDAVQ